MKFLADANTPGLLVESLTSLSHNVFWAYTVPRTPDLEWIEKAARERRVVITFDKDFGELVFKRGQRFGSGQLESYLPYGGSFGTTPRPWQTVQSPGSRRPKLLLASCVLSAPQVAQAHLVDALQCGQAS